MRVITIILLALLTVGGLTFCSKANAEAKSLDIDWEKSQEINPMDCLEALSEGIKYAVKTNYPFGNNPLISSNPPITENSIYIIHNKSFYNVQISKYDGDAFCKWKRNLNVGTDLEGKFSCEDFKKKPETGYWFDGKDKMTCKIVTLD